VLLLFDLPSATRRTGLARPCVATRCTASGQLVQVLLVQVLVMLDSQGYSFDAHCSQVSDRE
jgi:hypothetical protein